MPTIGAIADDFTGAVDLATVLSRRGFRTSVIFGSDIDWRDEEITSSTALVVALRSRTAPVTDAVHASLAALDALKKAGMQRFYFKYCSTFDSTPEGNIGPVLEALQKALGAHRTIVVPATPDSERTVYHGHLFVGRQLLNESPMSNHPLTPMSDSDLVALLTPQITGKAGLIEYSTVRAGVHELRQRLNVLTGEAVNAIVIDALQNGDMEVIGRATSDDILLSGGAGLAMGLHAPDHIDVPPYVVRRRRNPRSAVLMGSASETSQRQVRHAKQYLPHTKIDHEAVVADPSQEALRIVSWARQHYESSAAKPVLIYSSEQPADVIQVPDSKSRVRSDAIESAFALISQGLADIGVETFLVGGGETSGRVVSALGIKRLRLGQNIGTGLAWGTGLTSTKQASNATRSYSLALKSGNYGQTDFLTTAWNELA